MTKIKDPKSNFAKMLKAMEKKIRKYAADYNLDPDDVASSVIAILEDRYFKGDFRRKVVK